MNETLKVIEHRKSVRAYEPLAVSPEQRHAIVHAAMRAPTGGNMMLYSILEVEDQTIKERLAVTCDDQPFIAKAPLVLLFLADYQRWMDFFQHSGVEALCRTRVVVGEALVGDRADDRQPSRGRGRARRLAQREQSNPESDPGEGREPVVELHLLVVGRNTALVHGLSTGRYGRRDFDPGRRARRRLRRQLPRRVEARSRDPDRLADPAPAHCHLGAARPQGHGWPRFGQVDRDSGRHLDAAPLNEQSRNEDGLERNRSDSAHQILPMIAP